MNTCLPKHFALVAAAIWLTVASEGQAELVTMVNHGPSSNRVDLVFLGDGYTASEIHSTYVDHVENLLDHMFAAGEDPFPRYVNFFNVHLLNVVSREAGADVPPEGIFRDTALGATYYYDGGTERLLYVDEAAAEAALREGLGGADLTADVKLVAVNDTRFGGAGGSLAVYAGGNPAAAELALHELGHTLGHLADQYSIYEGPYLGDEPPQANVTAEASGQKWARWLGYVDPDHPQLGTVGVYEGGYLYGQGVYRPSPTSKMRSLGEPFDAVSREQLILAIYGFVDPLDSWLDNDRPLTDPAALWVDVVDPEVIQLRWLVDGRELPGATGTSLSPRVLGPGAYEISVHAYDRTPWVRLETDQLDQWVTWSVTITPEPTGLGLVLSAALASCGMTTLRRQGRRCRRKWGSGSIFNRSG